MKHNSWNSGGDFLPQHDQILTGLPCLQLPTPQECHGSSVPVADIGSFTGQQLLWVNAMDLYLIWWMSVFISRKRKTLIPATVTQKLLVV